MFEVIYSSGWFVGWVVGAVCMAITLLAILKGEASVSVQQMGSPLQHMQFRGHSLSCGWSA